MHELDEKNNYIDKFNSLVDTADKYEVEIKTNGTMPIKTLMIRIFDNIIGRLKEITIDSKIKLRSDNLYYFCIENETYTICNILYSKFTQSKSAKHITYKVDQNIRNVVFVLYSTSVDELVERIQKDIKESITTFENLKTFFK